MCWKAFPVQVTQRQKRHTWQIWDSCLELSQHSRLAPGLATLLSLPRADGLLLWEYHHGQVWPAVVGPAADSAGNLRRPGGWCQGWREDCREGWALGWYTSSLPGFQLSKKEEGDWEEETKAILLSVKGLRRRDLFAKSGGRLRGLPLRQKQREGKKKKTNHEVQRRRPTRQQHHTWCKGLPARAYSGTCTRSAIASQLRTVRKSMGSYLHYN